MTAKASVQPNLLDEIVRKRRTQLARDCRNRRIYNIQDELSAGRREKRDFVAALRNARRPAVIAELKRASPSRGRIRESFPVAELARAYERGGATAISVLTEEEHFEGRLEYLEQARAATTLPILRKDFIFRPFQVWESAAAGADAILLIAAMLDKVAMGKLIQQARKADLATLCEVHNRQELELALAMEPDCIGVNHRDLRTFQVDLKLGEELGPLLPDAVVKVAESGLRTPADLARMASSGFDAFLIGESFMRAPDPGAALETLLAGCEMPLVKICGITNRGDAVHACAAGAGAVGFVFAPSPREVTPEAVRAMVPFLSAEVQRVGVFAGAPITEIARIADLCGLHAVQLHGRYSPGEGQILAKQVSVWRAVSMPEEIEAARAWAEVAERFVLDHMQPDGISGGSGASFAWELAPVFARRLAEHVPAGQRLPEISVAGGLTPANVVEALRLSGARGVDVCSGVEQRPGAKDPAAIAAFCRQTRRVFWSRA
ncbi:MAG: indole-3-glycerol phosphate synthase TrpC [Terriglobales bacterium]